MESFDDVDKTKVFAEVICSLTGNPLRIYQIYQNYETMYAYDDLIKNKIICIVSQKAMLKEYPHLINNIPFVY